MKHQQIQRIAYWSDGFHLPEESARLCAEIGAFSADYQIAEFPIELPPDVVSEGVMALLAQQQEAVRVAEQPKT